MANSTVTATSPGIVGILLTMVIAWTAIAEEPRPIPLWKDGAPLAKGTEAKDQPQLWLYLPKTRQPHSAIVICPGGGYGHLAMDHEGHQIARWLGEQQMACFILEYRHRSRGYGHPAPLLDVQRAIRMVRSQGKAWGVDEKRVGVIGFSAGGHLASTVSTHFDSGNETSKDPIDHVSCRPDFAILGYPVISFTAPFTHRGSRKNLLGNDPDPNLVKSLSNEHQVTAKTPPTFLWHTQEDSGVPAQNSIAYFSALQRQKVPAELHIFQKGRHGLGLGKGHAGVETWPQLCVTWLHGIGILPAESKP